MKKIRLGNDIHVSWEILRNGEPEDFTDKVVEVKLVHAQTFTAVPIEWSIEGNVIEFDFFGKDQKRKGEYRIILTENRGELGMSTLDACGAFYLVDHSCMESDGTKCPTLKVQHVRLTGSFSLSGGGGKGSFPNVDELPTIDSLTGEEKVILTLQGENYQTNMNTVKEWAMKNNQFISYHTMADYDADKANLTEECYVAIDETEEVFLHKLKSAWNAYYELEEAYVNFMQDQGIDSLTGGAPLTLRADLFESFVVNGEERITGNEVFDTNNPAAAAIVVPINVGDVYEVSFKLKDLSGYAPNDINEFVYPFLYSPLTKITLDKSFASGADTDFEMPYILALYCIQGCPIMREITFNFEADPWKGTSAINDIARAFRSQGGIFGFFGNLTTGERIARIPNGDWGEEYSEGMDESKIGLVTVFTLPDDSYYNYTIERYDYGTI